MIESSLQEKKPARQRTWLLVIASTGALGVLVPLLLAWRHLPEPMATHWSLSGTPNGQMSRAFFGVFMLGLVLLLPTLLLFAASKRRSQAPAKFGSFSRSLDIAAAAGNTLLMAGLSALILAANWGRTHWREAAEPGIHTVGALLIGAILLGVIADRAARRFLPAASPPALAPTPALDLKPHESVYWSGTASNRWWFVAVAVTAVLAVLIGSYVDGTNASAAVLVAGAHLLPMLLLESFSKIRVSVTAQHLTIHYGHLGWFKQRIPLERVLGAQSFVLRPMEHGGWGYRGSVTLMRAAAVVVRGGPALGLELRDARRLSITVDDAETAARLINGLIQRQSAPA